MAATVPLGVLAFLDQMDFLAYLGCLYVPAQIRCFVVTKLGFAFHAIFGKVIPKYLGRTLITRSLLTFLELNIIFLLKFDSEDKMKIL